jgi:AbrB family looped-hinge helix DNA binding protein
VDYLALVVLFSHSPHLDKMANKKTEPPEQYTIRAGERGRLVLPVALRKRIGLQEGDQVVITVEGDSSLRLIGLSQQIQKAQGLFKDIAPGISLADELIQERRLEASQEQAT